jgi:hypothetical protein
LDLGGTLFRYGGRRGGGIARVIEAFGIEAAPEAIGATWREASTSAAAHFARQPFFLHRALLQAGSQHLSLRPRQVRARRPRGAVRR